MSVLLYGAECWKVNQNDGQRLNTFHNRCLRRILHMFWPRTISTEKQHEEVEISRITDIIIEDGIVLSGWKQANIMPLFEKGSRNKSENYRPVSLTSVVCKLLETLIRDHMVEFLVKQINKCISTWVPKSKVMSNQSIIFFEEITKCVDDGHQWMLST